METAAEVSKYLVDDLCIEYLAGKVDQDVINTIRSHKITGAMFLSLDNEQLKELFPTLGDRMSVKHLLKKFTDTAMMANENDTSKHSYLPVRFNATCYVFMLFDCIW